MTRQLLFMFSESPIIAVKTAGGHGLEQTHVEKGSGRHANFNSYRINWIEVSALHGRMQGISDGATSASLIHKLGEIPEAIE